MNDKAFDDIVDIFQEINIKTLDKGSDDNSVYKLNGVFPYNKKNIKVNVTYYSWENLSVIIIPCVKLPKGKISPAIELANRINNSFMSYDHFKIDPESGEVKLCAGFYSGMAEEKDDDAELNDGLDSHSYWHFRMLVSQMIGRSYLFSPLFKQLIKTTIAPKDILDNFWEKLSKKQKNDFYQYGEYSF